MMFICRTSEVRESGGIDRRPQAFGAPDVAHRRDDPPPPLPRRRSPSSRHRCRSRFRKSARSGSLPRALLKKWANRRRYAVDSAISRAVLPRGHRVCGVPDSSRPARLDDVHEIASAMPYVTVTPHAGDNPVYAVARKSFIFFRTPRPDAVDPDTGERYPDVIVFWVPSEEDKLALVQDPASPFFTTPHFNGHRSVLLRASRVGERPVTELTEVIQDAWLSRASARRARAWQDANGG